MHLRERVCSRVLVFFQNPISVPQVFVSSLIPSGQVHVPYKYEAPTHYALTNRLTQQFNKPGLDVSDPQH